MLKILPKTYIKRNLLAPQFTMCIFNDHLNVNDYIKNCVGNLILNFYVELSIIFYFFPQSASIKRPNKKSKLQNRSQNELCHALFFITRFFSLASNFRGPWMDRYKDPHMFTHSHPLSPGHSLKVLHWLFDSDR